MIDSDLDMVLSVSDSGGLSAVVCGQNNRSVPFEHFPMEIYNPETLQAVSR